MRKSGSLILTVMLSAVAGGMMWQMAKHRQLAPGNVPAASLAGASVSLLEPPSGQVRLCSWAAEDWPNTSAGQPDPMRRLPATETESELRLETRSAPAGTVSSTNDETVWLVPEQIEPQQPLLLSNSAPAHEISLPAPPAVSERAAGGPTLTPLELAERKEESRKPFMGIQNFNRSMEVDADWEEKTAQAVEIDPQILLSANLPNEVVSRTREMLEAATTLANRGAKFAARKQFEKIMRVTCQALDAQVGRSAHSLALARGLRAIEEADDFGLNGESAEFDLNLGGFIAGHDTPVLKDAAPAEVTALLAMQAYYRYAIEQLAIAGNNEPISSQALFSLGRMEALMSIKTDDIAGGGPKALAFYHAALAVDPNNGRAANELGVMLARRGKLREARNMFVQAASTQPTAVLNLSKVYRRLGNPGQAQQLAHQAKMIAARNPAAFQRGPEAGVRWVDHTTFVRDGAGSDVSPAQSAIRRASADATAAKSTASSAAFASGEVKAKSKPKLRLPFGWKK